MIVEALIQYGKGRRCRVVRSRFAEGEHMMVMAFMPGGPAVRKDLCGPVCRLMAEALRTRP